MRITKKMILAFNPCVGYGTEEELELFFDGKTSLAVEEIASMKKIPAYDRVWVLIAILSSLKNSEKYTWSFIHDCTIRDPTADETFYENPTEKEFQDAWNIAWVTAGITVWKIVWAEKAEDKNRVRVAEQEWQIERLVKYINTKNLLDSWKEVPVPQGLSDKILERKERECRQKRKLNNSTSVLLSGGEEREKVLER